MTIMRIMSRTMPRFHIQAGAWRNFGSLNFTSLIPGEEQLAAPWQTYVPPILPTSMAKFVVCRGKAAEDMILHWPEP